MAFDKHSKTEQFIHKVHTMKAKYVKKPIPVEAIQYDGSNFEELADFAGPDIYRKNN